MKKSSILRNFKGCNNFSKVFQHFKRMDNSFRQDLYLYSEIFIFCVIQYIDFQKQPVGSVLKLFAKSLKIIIDEFHIIINLHSFLLPLSPLGKTFLQVSHLPPLRQNSKVVRKHGVDFHLCLSRLTSRIHPFFSLACLGKLLKFMVFRFVEYAIVSQKIEYSYYLLMALVKTLPQVLSITPWMREITDFPRQRFFENLFPQPTERGRQEQMMIFLIKVQSESTKTTWNSSLFIFYMICNFF